MHQGLKIGFITTEDPHDRRSWSGTLHHLLVALTTEVGAVGTFGPLRPQPELFLARAFNFISLRLFGKRFNYRDSFLLSRAYGRQLDRMLRGSEFDLLIAPAGMATIAHLNTRIPIVYINDRCLAGALDYHAILSGLSASSRREGLALEEQTLSRSSVVIYASQWAADAAKAHYPQHAHIIHVLPFGANLETGPPVPENRIPAKDGVKLLFLGTKWEEKGGPIAYETLLALKRQGVQARLVVCGCEPPAAYNDRDLVREGFLDKNIPAHRDRLHDLLSSADVLIVPTRFEAYGIVFCEAAAYGLPVLATRTGGVPTIVVEASTGHLFDMDQDGEAYAARIMEMLKDPDQWMHMRKAARTRYEQVLNWKKFTQQLLAYAGAPGPINKDR